MNSSSHEEASPGGKVLAPLGTGNYEAYSDAAPEAQASFSNPYAAMGNPYAQTAEAFAPTADSLQANSPYALNASPYQHLSYGAVSDPLAELERQSALELGGPYNGAMPEMFPGSMAANPYGSAGGASFPSPWASHASSPYSEMAAQSLASGGSPYATQAWRPALTQSVAHAVRRKTLKVIHVGECLVQAGIEQWLRNLIRYSDSRRMRITRCIATSPTVDPRVAAEMGAPVEIGQDKSIQRAALECDILLVSGPGDVAAWLGPYRPKLCVFVAHGDARWTQQILHQSAPVVDHVIAVSESASQICRGFPCTVIPNGIDSTHVAQSRPRELVRRQLGFQEDDTVLGFVGRFSPEKRPQAVIEAVAGLPQNYKALLVGWGGMRDPLMALANQLIPGRFAFAEATEHLGDYYHAMDCFFLPSVSEGFALVVMEAMYCGTPVVAAPVGCVNEIIVDRVNGIVAPHGAESLRQAAQLIRNHPRWAQSIAEEGRIFAQRYGHARDMARKYEDLLERLWHTKQASPLEASAERPAPSNSRSDVAI